VPILSSQGEEGVELMSGRSSRRRISVIVKLNLHKEAMRSNLLPDETPFLSLVEEIDSPVKIRAEHVARHGCALAYRQE
jgi:hypothetical protein